MTDATLCLFDYPNEPGFKARQTSADAARGIKSAAATIRERVLEAVRAKPGTPEEIAERIGEPVMNVRPRCSELAAKRLIEDSGKRGEAMGGRRAIVWRAVAR